MLYITHDDVIRLHETALRQHGGSAGIRDTGALASCLEQPLQTFFGTDLYPLVSAKAAALCYFLAENHPFVDGNKRTAHASMEYFLLINGYQLSASIDESERVVLEVASGKLSHTDFAAWVSAHLVAL